jgi:CBS domain-containing protein
MTEYPTTVPAYTTVAALVDDWFMKHECSAFPVVDDRGSVTGMITLAKVRSINRDRWSTLAVSDVADPRDAVATGSPAELLADLLPRMSAAAGGAGRALVFDDEQLVGIVSPTDVQRAIELAALRTPQNRG